MVSAPKSVAVAVVLSILWMGAGHIYAGKTKSGFALAAFDFALGMFSLTMIGLVITIPVWLVMTPIVAVLAAAAVKDHNRNAAQPRF